MRRSLTAIYQGTWSRRLGGTVAFLGLCCALALAEPPLTPEQKGRLKERDRFQAASRKADADGRLAEAVASVEKMLAVEREVLGDIHDDTAGSQTWLARLLAEQGDFVRARAAAGEAVTIHAKLHGETHWQTRTTRFGLADVERLSKLDETNRKRVFEARRQHRLALSLYNQGKYADALAADLKALEVRQVVLGDAHLDTARTLDLLGLTHQKLKDFDQAEARLREAAEVWKRAVGELHPDRATTLENLAYLLNVRGNLDESVAVYRQAATVCEKTLGETHGQHLRCLRSLAALRERQARKFEDDGKFDDARAARQEVIDLYVRTKGADHWWVVEARQQLADVDRLARLNADDRARLREARAALGRSRELRQQGKLAEAVEAANQALKTRQALLGEDHPDVAAVLHDLGYLARLQKDHKASARFFEQAAAIREKTLGDHPDTAYALNGLAIALDNQQDHAGARKQYEKALAIHRKTQGEDHLDVAIVLTNLAQVLESKKEYDQARTHLERALAIRRKVQGEEHADTVKSARTLDSLNAAALTPQQRKDLLDEGNRLAQEAVKLRDAGKFAEAAPLAEKILAMQRRLFGHYQKGTADVLTTLAQLYERSDDFDHLRSVRREILTVYRQILPVDHHLVTDAIRSLAEVDRLELLDPKDRARLREADGLVEQANKLRRQNKHAEALARGRQAADAYRSILGEEDPLTAKGLFGVAMTLREQGDHARARPLIEQALAILRKEEGESHPDVGYALLGLGSLERDQKDYPAARRHMEQAVAVFRKSLGDVDAATVDAEKALAGVVVLAVSPEQRRLRLQERDRLEKSMRHFEDTKNYAAALGVVEKMLAIEREVLGDMSEDVASSLDWLGFLHEKQREFPAAVTARKEQLLLYRKLYGDAHWWTVNVRTSLADDETATRLDAKQRESLAEADRLAGDADVAFRDGKLQQALEPAQKALAAHRELLGEKTPVHLNDLNRLGRIHAELKEIERAEEFYRQALTLIPQLVGEMHPLHADLLGNLGLLYRKANDPSKAAAFLRQCLAIRRQTQGDKSDATSGAVDNLATALHELDEAAVARDDIVAARQAVQEVIDLQSKRGDKHKWLVDMAHMRLTYLDVLGRLDAEQRRSLREAEEQMRLAAKLKYSKPAEALEAARKALAKRRGALPPESAEFMASLKLVAELSVDTKQPDQAVTAYHELVDIHKRIKAKDGFSYRWDRDKLLELLDRLARAALEQEDFAAARKLRQDALVVNQEHIGEKDWRTTQAQRNLEHIDVLARLSADDRRLLGETGPVLDTAHALAGERSFSRYKEEGLVRCREGLAPVRLALETRRRLLTDNHPATVEALHVLGILLKSAEDYASAETTLRRALEMRRRLLGADNPATLETFDALSETVASAQAINPAHVRLTPDQVKRLQERDEQNTVFRSAEKLTDAITAVEKMLEIEREVRGANHPETIASLENLADLLLKKSDFDGARRYADEVAAIKTKRYGADHWQTAEARFQVRLIDTLRSLTPEQRRSFWDAYYLRWDVTKKLPPPPPQFSNEKDKRVPVLIPVAEGLRDTVRDLLGEGHLYHANCLASLAELHKEQGDLAQAAKLDLQAADVTGKALGVQNPLFLRRLNNAADDLAALARAAELREDFPAAQAFWQKRIDLIARRSGAEHWSVKDAQLRLTLSERLAELNREERNALKSKNTASNIDVFTEEEPEPYLAEAFADALRRASALVEVRTRLLGENSRETANALASVGMIQRLMCNPRAAADALKKALSIRKPILGEMHPAYAQALNELGLVLYHAGEFAQAEPLLRQARDILGKLDRLDPAYLSSLNNLAVLLQALGDLDGADELLREAFDASKKRRAEGRPQEGGPAPLGRRYESLMGQFNLATILSERPQTVENPLPTGVLPEDAAAMNNLALVCTAHHQFDRARTLQREALGIIQQTVNDGADDPIYGIALDNLALVAKESGDADLAELLYHRAVKLLASSAKHARRHAAALNNQGQFYFERGDLERAGRLWQEAFQIRMREFGPDHPATIVNRANLALLAEMGGDMKEAESQLRKALSSARTSLELAFAVQSERQQVLRMQALRGYVDYYLSLAERAHLPPGETYQVVLAWKGSVFVRQRELRQRTEDAAPAQAESERLYRELETTTRALGAILFEDPEQEADRVAEIEILTKRKEDLEHQLAGLGGEFKSRQPTPDELRKALPSGAVLIDLLEYSHFTPPKAGAKKGEMEGRVIAFVLRPDRPGVVSVDLGRAQPIAEAVERWRSALERREDQRAAGAELRDLVWRPLEEHLRDARLVLISPDGPLARVPFAALPGKKAGTYLLEEVSLAQAPVPRILPVVLAARVAKVRPAPALLVMGEVDFGNPEAASEKAPRKPRFMPLPATVAEINAITEVFEKTIPGGEVRPLRGPKATGGGFRAGAPGAAYLHLATHGFFTPAKTPSALAPSQTEPAEAVQSSDRGRTTAAHPGSLSGIVFAGANRTSGTGDAILTSLEVGALDLRDTELVVLSACQTGLGDLSGGEGVLGLQRGFHLAGARTVVASLWKVNDDATAALMERFYDNLWRKKLGPAEALRQAQLSLLHTAGGSGTLRGFEIVEDKGTGSRQVHPALWAAWVLSGDPGEAPTTVTAPSPSLPDKATSPVASTKETAEASPPADAAPLSPYWPWGVLGGAGGVVGALVVIMLFDWRRRKRI
jgi:CHAT domain-containing protein/Tfp pilus assembly protein PilF